mmetsp:Transcript_11432/g.42940  ORF Transcript_11432/g.42940 Transcript_11432/m.42940 type:complete len:304 (+) Transcript_11432:394-1305(+)
MHQLVLFHEAHALGWLSLVFGVIFILLHISCLLAPHWLVMLLCSCHTRQLALRRLRLEKFNLSWIVPEQGWHSVSPSSIKLVEQLQHVLNFVLVSGKHIDGLLGLKIFTNIVLENKCTSETEPSCIGTVHGTPILQLWVKSILLRTIVECHSRDMPSTLNQQSWPILNHVKIMQSLNIKSKTFIQLRNLELFQIVFGDTVHWRGLKFSMQFVWEVFGKLLHDFATKFGIAAHHETNGIPMHHFLTRPCCLKCATGASSNAKLWLHVAVVLFEEERFDKEAQRLEILVVCGNVALQRLIRKHTW